MIKVYTLNAFTDDVSGGNPAGVVLDADNLTEKQMQGIAKKVGFSETAFVMSSDSADFRVRFFTPSDEVDLCGHATIATFKLLLLKGRIATGVYKQETLAGILSVEALADGSILMEQSIPEYYEIIEPSAIAKSLGLLVSELSEDYPVQVVSTGLKDIMVPVKSLEALKNINPDFEAITDISKKYESTGYHVFTTESLSGADCACRNFAPLYDIDEEAATGTASGALSSYLFKYKVLKDKTYNRLAFEQGYYMNSPSRIIASLHVTDDEITGVYVGGNAIVTGEIDIKRGI